MAAARAGHPVRSHASRKAACLRVRAPSRPQPTWKQKGSSSVAQALLSGLTDSLPGRKGGGSALGWSARAQASALPRHRHAPGLARTREQGAQGHAVQGGQGAQGDAVQTTSPAATRACSVGGEPGGAPLVEGGDLEGAAPAGDAPVQLPLEQPKEVGDGRQARLRVAIVCRAAGVAGAGDQGGKQVALAEVASLGGGDSEPAHFPPCRSYPAAHTCWARLVAAALATLPPLASPPDTPYRVSPDCSWYSGTCREEGKSPGEAGGAA